MGARSKNENLEHGTKTERRNLFIAKATIPHRVKIENGLS